MTDTPDDLGPEPPRNEREQRVWDMRDVSRDTGEPRRQMMVRIVDADYADWHRRRADMAERTRDEALECWQQANGVASLARKHRDMAEQEAGELRALLCEAMRRAQNHEYICASDHGNVSRLCNCGLNDLRARVAAVLGEKP